MITCPNCQKEQPEGNFCENCGGALTAEGAQVVSSPQVTTSNAEQTTESALKKESTAFFHYFSRLVKKPTTALYDTESSFIQALIAFFLLPIALATFIYLQLNMQYMQIASYISFDEYSYLEIVSKIAFIYASLLFAGLLASGLVVKMTTHINSKRAFFTQYSGLLVIYGAIAIVISILASVGVINITTYDNDGNYRLIIFLLFAFLVPLIINPVLVTFHHLSKNNNTGQAYYLSLLTLVLTLFFSYILVKMYVMEVIESFEYFF